MRRYTLATLSLMAFFLLAPAAMAQAQQPGAPQQEGGPGYAGPTAQQCEALAALRKEHHQAVMLPKLELKAKQAELNVLLAAPQADQAKIAAVTNEITALHGKILAAQNDYRRKVFEETGHLIRGGMKHGAQWHGMGGGMGGGMGMRGQACNWSNCPNCPMRPSPQPDQSE